MIAVVVPSNRSASLLRWTAAWRAEFDRPDVRLYVVTDEPQTWMQIDRALGDDAWIISRQSDGIRCWGFYQAWRDGADYVVTLDDDCYPIGTSAASSKDGIAETDLLRSHLDRLMTPHREPAWMDTLTGLRGVDGSGLGSSARGFPQTYHREAPVMLAVGGWKGVPDLDGETQCAVPGPWSYGLTRGIVPPGVFAPMSAMNLAVTRQLLPALWFPPMGTTGMGRHRFGDIWAGLWAKRILDHLGGRMSIGTPWVQHDRASDPIVNRERERLAKAEHETLWPRVAAAILPGTEDVPALMHALAGRVDWPYTGDGYWERVREGMRRWANLFR